MKECISMFFALSAAFLLFLSSPAEADVRVKFLDGTEMMGKLVRETDSKIVLKTVAGIQVINKADIKTIERNVLSRKDLYRRLLKSKDLTKASSHIEIAKWCLKNDMKVEYFIHMNKAIKIDPDNETAHKALGHVPYEKKWVDENGKIHAKIIWVTRKERERLIAREKAEARKAKGEATPKEEEGKAGITGFASLPEHEPLTPEEKEFIMRYIRDLGSNDWRTRERAVNTLLIQTFAHKLPPLLVDVLKNGSETAKVAALEALLKMNYTPVLGIVQQLAARDPSPKVRRQAVYFLGQLGGPRSASLLVHILNDKNMEVVTEAISALEQITFVVYDYLGKPDVAKARAIYSAWVQRHGTKTRKQFLEEMARRGKPRQRIKASALLYKMGEIKALYNIVELLTHEDVAIQAEANRKLIALTGEDLLFDPQCEDEEIKRKWAENWKLYVAKLAREAGAKKKKSYASGEKAVVLVTPDILKALDGSAKEREEARAQIRAMPKQKAVPLLIRGLNDPNITVRIRCFNLLKEITGMDEDLGYDPGEEKETIRLVFIKKWRAWFEKHKDELVDQPAPKKKEKEAEE